MTIPFMRLDRQFQSIRDQVTQAVMPVFETGNVLQSKEVSELERRVATLCGLKHAVAVNSGTDALIFALVALDLKPGSRVAVTAMSFVASASAILHAGHRPVFVDVDPATMLMDNTALVALIEKGMVDAVIAVHLYGQLLDLKPVRAATDKRGIPLIEDAAQALGATRHGAPAGSAGVLTCLSFDPTKVIGAYGSGGAVATDDDALAAALRLLRYHGHAGGQRYTRLGFNSQLDSVQAAILGAKLTHLQEWQNRRIAIAGYYDEAVHTAGMRPMTVLAGNVHNYHKYVLWAENREMLQRHLETRGVQTKVQYPIPLHRQPLFDTTPVSLPRVEEAADHILSLPIYAELTDAEVDTVCDALRGAAG